MISRDEVSRILCLHRDRELERDRALDEFRDEDGNVIESRYAEYDEVRIDIALMASEDLSLLLDELEELVANSGDSRDHAP